MKPSQTEINEFLKWFSTIEAIPLRTRRDFFAHVSEVGGIDSKSVQFIEKTLDDLSDGYDQQIEEVKRKWNIFSVALMVQEKPEYSLRGRILDFFQGKMITHVERFTSYFKNFQKEEIKTQETAEDVENAAQIARLKATL